MKSMKRSRVAMKVTVSHGPGRRASGLMNAGTQTRPERQRAQQDRQVGQEARIG
jgi:hypothetical protein